MAIDDLLAASLYHLATEDEWADYLGREVIDPGSLEAEGFVHCSWGHQVPGTVAKHFAGVTGLVALELDPEALGSVHLVEEDSYGAGQAFPHAYGPLPVAAVIAQVTLA